MKDFKVDHKQKTVKTNLKGYEILSNPKLNKDTAFTKDERDFLHLDGLLPCYVESIDEQVERCYQQFLNISDNLSRNIFLNGLHDRNQTLFYQVIQTYIDTMLPIIYTPTIGDAVKNFSQQYRSNRGLYLAYNQKDKIESIVNDHLNDDIKMVIITDGEGVLGIGDWGVGGMDIAIGKMMVYVACSLINPAHVLPVILDVGTNNEDLVNHPNYIGARHKRIVGKTYDQFVDDTINVIIKKHPDMFIHFEDFGRNNARRLLDRYQSNLCVFNDDVQGTGLIALATIKSASHLINQTFESHRFVILGPGTAGIGVADALVEALIKKGISREKAQKSIWLVGRRGLLYEGMDNVFGDQIKYLRDASEISSWADHSLQTTIEHVKPTVLIGCSGVYEAFTETCIKTMASSCERPIIMPLSNPTACCEANPVDIFNWTNGQALVATGSPFQPVTFNGKSFSIAQCNNAYIFPGLGMGIIGAKAKLVTQNMLLEASSSLSRTWSKLKKKNDDRLLPPLNEDYHDYSLAIAKAVMIAAIEDKVSDIDLADVDQTLESLAWSPEYYQFKPL